jgi:FKBP-type peptidyl-prolyl cis-trans isomerase 2
LAIKDGDTIKIDYTGTLDDGTVFDSSEDHGQPLEFTVGEGQVIQGFDSAVKGMEEGEEKEFRIEADQAYGAYNEELTRSIPKDNIPEDMDIQPGMMLGLQLPDGQQIPAKVAQIGEEEILLDMNHPLAGQALTFNIQVKEISS